MWINNKPIAAAVRLQLHKSAPADLIQPIQRNFNNN